MNNLELKKYTNIITSNVASKKERLLIDKMIDLETQRRILLVPEAGDFDVRTACYIDNDFRCVSEYELPDELYEKLKNA